MVARGSLTTRCRRHVTMIRRVCEHLSDTDTQLTQALHNTQWIAFIKGAIAARKNIIISGGASSGKTTFLNACLREIPHHECIIVLEDTRELHVPHDNVVRLLASKWQQGHADLSQQDLLQCALRLRPDRIIMGELRGKEIMDFITAYNTGHEGTFTTLHANSPQGALRRMVQLYKLNHVPAMQDQEILREIHHVVDVIIQLKKTAAGRCAHSIYFKGAQHLTAFNGLDHNRKKGINDAAVRPAFNEE